jgi:predicted nucleic acid-binding protein
VLFDSRYFWAVFTEDDQEVLAKLKSILGRTKSVFASSVSVYEVYKLTLAHEGKDVAELRAATIKKQFTVVDVSAEIAEEGARIGHRLSVPMADALIMATAKRLRVACVTDDPHFTEVKTIWIR